MNLVVPPATRTWQRSPARGPDRAHLRFRQARLLAHLTGAWLLRHARRLAATGAAYRRDLQQWFVYCGRAGVDPLRARPADVDLWMVDRRRYGARGTRPAAEATIARRVVNSVSLGRYERPGEEDGARDGSDTPCAVWTVPARTAGPLRSP